MKTGWARTKRRFFNDRRGAAAVEFALLAPVLCLVLGISVELGRMLIAYRQFEGTVVGIARHVARYPEYEIRAREYAKPMPASLFPDGDLQYLNIIVNSLVKNKGNTVMTEVFPGNVIYGNNPGMRWQDYVDASAYADDESVIFVGATYVYHPLFSLVPQVSLTFKKEFQILPSFGRVYPWNDGQVDDSKYVY